ncbi:uncharacterized protein LOC130367573 isoform X4 [Hyla sarda]|uniref:uncharacterized protein LOC130367573 isoform X4 n=1 Tax=Hyla sarda TaxID=327740 RepID=UPI0024C3D532|nr:uncharacterized protein LOC130367573 isoform X4 [Hyla sarda]
MFFISLNLNLGMALLVVYWLPHPMDMEGWSLRDFFLTFPFNSMSTPPITNAFYSHTTEANAAEDVNESPGGEFHEEGGNSSDLEKTDAIQIKVITAQSPGTKEPFGGGFHDEGVNGSDWGKTDAIQIKVITAQSQRTEEPEYILHEGMDDSELGRTSITQNVLLTDQKKQQSSKEPFGGEFHDEGANGSDLGKTDPIQIKVMTAQSQRTEEPFGGEFHDEGANGSDLGKTDPIQIKVITAQSQGTEEPEYILHEGMDDSELGRTSITQNVLLTDQKKPQSTEGPDPTGHFLDENLNGDQESQGTVT